MLTEETGQTWFLSILTALGLPTGDNQGVCFGLTKVWERVILSGHAKEFFTRIKDLNKIYLAAANDALVKISLPECTDLRTLTRNEFQEFTFYLQDNLKKRFTIDPSLPSEDKQFILDAIALGNEIEIAQNARKYLFLYNQSGRNRRGEKVSHVGTQVSSLVSSILNPTSETQTKSIPLSTGIYSQEEMIKWLALVSETFAECQYPIVINVLGRRHAHLLEFKAKTKTWTLVDPNYMPLVMSFKSDDLQKLANLARYIGNAGNQLACAATIQVNKKDAPETLRLKKGLAKKSEWQALHDYQQKVHLSDDKGLNWIHLAMEVADRSTLRKLLAQANEQEKLIALFSAIKTNNLNLVKLAVNSGANVNGITPNFPIRMAVSRPVRNKKIIKLLLEKGDFPEDVINDARTMRQRELLGSDPEISPLATKEFIEARNQEENEIENMLDDYVALKKERTNPPEVNNSLDTPELPEDVATKLGKDRSGFSFFAPAPSAGNEARQDPPAKPNIKSK